MFPRQISKSRIFIFSILFILLNIADILLTDYALGRGLSEGNPMLSGNIQFLIPIKALGIALIITAAIYCERKYQTSSAMIAPSILIGVVVVWNVVQIIKSGVI